VQVGDGSKKVTNVECGDRHSIVRLEDGSFYGSGINEHGQLGSNGVLVEEFSKVVLPS